MEVRNLARKSIEKIAQEIALPIVEELGYELVDLEYKKRGSSLVPEIIHR